MNPSESTSQSLIESENAAAAIDQTLVVTWPIPYLLAFLIALLMATFAYWIYRTERGNSRSGMRWLLASLRCSLMLLVVWMLTGWSWQRARVELPELVIAVDVSDSMLTGDGTDQSDSGSGISRLERAQQLLSLEQDQWDSLNERYQVRVNMVADGPSQLKISSGVPNLKQSIGQVGDQKFTQQSRLGESLIQVIEGQAGRGTAAIVFLSDGISTVGQSLIEAGQRARRSAIPIHTVSIGRRSAQPDLRIGDILAENQVYLGDQVNVEATVIASDIRETVTQVQLIELDSGQVVDEQPITLGPTETQTSVTMRYTPEQPGDKELQIAVQPIPGETDSANNNSNISLKVQDRVIRVMLVFSQPSYEFRFLKHFLERAKQNGPARSATFELTSILQNGDTDYVLQDSTAHRFVPSDPAELAKVDVFVFGPLDISLIPRSSQQAIVRSITHGGSGCIFLGASSEAIQQFGRSPLGILLPIENGLQSLQLERGFQIEPTKIGQSSLPLQWSDPLMEPNENPIRYPVLQSLLSVGSVKPGAQILANAMTTPDGAGSPFIVTQFAGAGRTSFIATDETYRWTSAFGSDQYHQQFWGHMLRWLCRSKLNTLNASELTVEPKQARLGQPVRFQLRLPLGEDLPKQAELRIEELAGQKRTVSLNQAPSRGDTYSGTLDQLVAGEYRAVVVQPALTVPPAVEFSVAAPLTEQANLRVDEEAMRQLAELSRGKAHGEKDGQQWFRHLPTGTSLRLGSLPPQPIWNQHWVAFLFVSLITLEWLLRRRARML